MNNLKIFNSEEFGEIRTAVVEGEPWFCLTDICRALELTNPSMVKERLQEKGINSIDTLTKGGTQQLLYVNESNLYKTIFQSRKESAERFTEWVTGEVLPTIRKTGSYEMPGMTKEIRAILLLDTRTAQLMKQSDQMEKRMDKLEFDIPLYGSEADELSSHVKRKGVKVLGGKESEAYQNTEVRAKIYRDIYDQIKREFGIYDDTGRPKSYKALKRKYLADAHDLIDCYEVPVYLEELIETTNTRVHFEDVV